MEVTACGSAVHTLALILLKSQQRAGAMDAKVRQT